MKKLNNKGFGLIEGLLIIIALALVAGVGYYVYNSNKKDTDDSTQKTLQSNTSQTKSEAKTDPNEGYFVVKEWGLRFKVPSGLKDIRYTINNDTLAFYAKPSNFSVEYRSDYANLNENGKPLYATGEIIRSKDSTKESIGSTVNGKKLGDYYYYTAWAFSGLASGAACLDLYTEPDQSKQCEANLKAFQLVNQGETSLINSIELAK